MEYCLRLKFEEEPSYSYLRKLFKFAGSIDWNDKNTEIKKIEPKDKISDSGLDTPDASISNARNSDTLSRCCPCTTKCTCIQYTYNKYP